MTAKQVLQKLLRTVGYDIIRLTPMLHPLPRRKLLFASYDIGLVLDVGANTGQFAYQTRKEVGYENCGFVKKLNRGQAL